MRAAFVVEIDPVADDARRVLDALETMPMSALLFQRPDHPLDHASLLGAVRGDVVLPYAIVAKQGREVSACKDQANIRPQKGLMIEFALNNDQGIENA